MLHPSATAGKSYDLCFLSWGQKISVGSFTAFQLSHSSAFTCWVDLFFRCLSDTSVPVLCKLLLHRYCKKIFLLILSLYPLYRMVRENNGATFLPWTGNVKGATVSHILSNEVVCYTGWLPGCWWGRPMDFARRGWPCWQWSQTLDPWYRHWQGRLPLLKPSVMDVVFDTP